MTTFSSLWSRLFRNRAMMLCNNTINVKVTFLTTNITFFQTMRISDKFARILVLVTVLMAMISLFLAMIDLNVLIYRQKIAIRLSVSIQRVNVNKVRSKTKLSCFIMILFLVPYVLFWLLLLLHHWFLLLITCACLFNTGKLTKTRHVNHVAF